MLVLFTFLNILLEIAIARLYLTHIFLNIAVHFHAFIVQYLAGGFFD